LPEIAGEGASRAALLVDPLDTEALTHGLLQITGDEALRRRLEIAGLANSRRFSWEKAGREVLAALETAL
jgi:glycosyltransferase involved in cell wall biosynthesis